MKELIGAGAILATGFLAGLLILRAFDHSKKFDWSQQSLRYPAQEECRAQGRIPLLDYDGLYLECLPERR